MKTIFQIVKECEGGVAATPCNTLGMGNPMVDGNVISEPLPTGKIKKEKVKPKKLKESLIKNIGQDDESIKVAKIKEFITTYISGNLSGFEIEKDGTINFDMSKQLGSTSGYLNAYFDDGDYERGGNGFGWEETELPKNIKFGTLKCRQVSFEGWYKLKSLKNFPKKVTGRVCFINCPEVNWKELKNIKADRYLLVGCFDDVEDYEAKAREFEKKYKLKPGSVEISEY